MELAWPAGEAALRDSKHPGPTLTFARARLDALVARTKAGDFDHRG